MSVIVKSGVPGKVPTSAQLDYGQLALNYADQKLYFKNSSNQIVQIGGSSGVQTFSAASTLGSTTWSGGTDFITLVASTGSVFSEQALAFQEVGTNIGAKIGVKNTSNGAYDIIFANRPTTSTTSTMTERLRITASNGHLFKTTTSTLLSPTSRFALATSSRGDIHLFSNEANGTSTTNTKQYGITYAPNGTATQAGIVISENGADGTGIGFFCTNSYATGPQLRAYILPTGDFVAAGNVTAYSDIRLKTELLQISNAVDKVKSLTGYTYTRRDTGKRQTGLIAQDVKAVLPEAVEEDGEHLSLAYGNLVGLLVEAIKELEIRLQVIERKLDASPCIGCNKPKSGKH